MHKQARQSLKLIRTLTQNTSVEFRHELYEHCLCLEANPDKHIDCTSLNNEMYSLLVWLSEQKYIAHGITPGHYVLTQKGMHPMSISWEETKSFLFSSLFVPIVVSAITSLITLAIKGALQ